MNDNDRGTAVLAFLVAIGLAMILIVKIVHAVWVYDDWTCAVSRCVKVKP